ncbi:hypothetical protein [Halarcobacter anaerophilus]|uniref:Uncharacterized protein n=1 Tax=Halarcobacter anaerophilus TaxID=877500 RepID=A0A4Q0Y0R8_9BACT|nr:hypothetical protein [Halarcobacter anaerophilus]QDF29005.1 hypothetical protein AANAER_1525 [Halarcobacter anaerophilus]RXJ63640.1 hypothetical protein CRV06_05450 [Halarcobacter anaerophilus]
MFDSSKIYIYIAISVGILSLLGYGYYLKSENEILTLNNQTLKVNQKQIISAYEQSIKVLEQKAFEEGLNKQSAKTAEELNRKVAELSKKRGEINEKDIDSNVYVITSF